VYLQASLGLSQLTKLETFVQRRRDIARAYSSAFANAALRLPTELPGVQSAFHLYVVRLLDLERQPALRVVHERLHAAGIGVNLHYIPVYRQPYFSLWADVRTLSRG